MTKIIIKKDKTKNFRSLMVTLIIAFLSLNAIVLLTSSTSLILFNFQTEKNLIAYQQQLIAQNAANTSKHFILHKIDILNDGIRLTNLGTIEKKEQKFRLGKLLGLDRSFRQIILFNTEKHELLRVTRLSKVTSKKLIIKDDDDLFNQIKVNKLYVSSIYIDNISYEPMVLIAVPVMDVFDDFKGILVAELNLKFMWDLVGGMKIGKNGLVYIIDRAGNLIAFKDIARVLKGENLRHIKEVNKFVNKENHIINRGSISKGIQDNYVVSTHIPFEIPDWAIVVELPVFEAYKTIIMSLIISILIIILSFTLIIIVSVYLSKIITQPVMNLRDAVKDIGKGNLDIKIKTESKDEIGELALSFNQMIKDLKTTTVSRDSLKREINERKEVEEELRRTEEKFRRIFNEALDAIIIADVETGILLDCNPATTRLIGRKKSEIIGQHQRILHPKEELSDGEFTKSFKEHLNEKRGQSIETQVITKSGKIKYVSITATVLEIGGRKVIQGVFRDITEQKKAEEKIKSLAYYDQLTNLSNRTLFLDRLKIAISTAKRYKKIFALIFIDIDNFKIINDALGHLIGDKLIVEISKCFLKCLRAEDSFANIKYSKINSKKIDSVSRIGGDEFTILLSEINEPKDASIVVMRIQKELLKSFIIDGNTINISISVGIAIYPNDGENIENLIKNADIAMYNAKSLGRNNFQYYNHSMNISAQKWLAIGNELRKALDNKDFTVYYQPIIDIKLNQIIGLEALVRWIHPKKGLIPPMDFIPIAEEIGLIVNIGEQVLNIVGNHYKKWISHGFKKIEIAVNISPKQLNHKNFITIVKNVIKKYHIPSDLLTLEITENCIINNIQAINIIINEIRKLGIRISLDDFGAGYTSFLTLKQIPFDIIKIDRLFIAKIPDDTENSIITSSIISIGHNFNLKVVAEGVENESQLSFLKFWNCDMVQGYYYYKPLPEDKIIKLLSKKKIL